MYKKSLFLIALMALLAPLALFGQTAVTVDGSHPFFDNFEGEACEWEFVNGESTNAWYWGTSICNGGTHSVYISNDGGVSNAYSNSTTWVYFWKLITIAEAGSYRFSYDWRCDGNSDDYILVGLMAESATLTPGSQYPSASWTSLSTLYDNSNWSTKNVNIIVAAGTYKLVFAWRNNNSYLYNPPGAIDNVGITKLNMGSHTTQVTQASTDDFNKGTGSNVNIANGDVSLQYKMASVADWNATTNLPQNLKDHQVVTWRNYVYCVGGMNSSYVNSVYCATQQDNGISSWTSVNALPVALKDMAVIATQTQLVVIGGRNNEGVSNKIYSAALNNDGTVGAWEELSISLPQPCWGARVVEALGNLYLIGGANADTENDATNKVYRLTLNAIGKVTGITEMTALPEARNGHAATVYNSKIIVTGGYDATFTQKNTVYTIAVNLDGSLGSWQTNTALPNAVYGHTTVCTNGILTIIGGKEGSLESNKFFYADADAATYEWQLSDINLPERYTQGASFVFGNKIFYCGGVNLSGSLNNAVCYMAVNPSTTTVGHPVFVSWPFNVGTPKQMVELSYSLINLGSYGYEVLYRTADEDCVFSNWTSVGSDHPITLGQTKSFVQYMFRITATGEDNFFIENVSLTLNGYTQLGANLNYIVNLTADNGPYLVTETVSFTSGVHYIGPGVVIMFMPETGMNIGEASVNFNGTEEHPILLTAYEAGSGSWNGVFYDDYSDYNGLTSVMEYTTIEKAGNGENESNLRLKNTNQPTISHCSFNLSIKEGVWLHNSNPTLSDCTFDGNKYGIWLDYSSPVCTSCTMSNNTSHGLALYDSAPTVTDCTMTGNEYAGIYFDSNNFNASFSGVTSSNNLYGMYSCSPDRSFNFDESVVAFADNVADIAVAGGQIRDNRTWNYYANGYVLLGNVEVYKDTSTQPKLIIAAGNTIKVRSGCYLYVGYYGNNGGQLYAVGTATAPITFTSLDGSVGGWNGLYFRNGSDYNSSSSLRYCVVEKAVNNLYCESTNQPNVMWCTFQDATNNNVSLYQSNISIEGCTLKNAMRGLSVESNSNPTVINVVFENHSEACVRLYDNNCSATYNNCTLKDSQVGIYYSTLNMDITDVANVTFENNVTNFAVPGGTMSTNHTWGSNTYTVFGTINIYSNNSSNLCTLTLSPGSVLKFAQGGQLRVDSYGSLIAEGTAEQPITFTSENGEAGGWNGIYFLNGSDYSSEQHSSLKHCIVENGNNYNLYIENTDQPSLIENCSFQNSASKGVYSYYSNNNFSNCVFEDNAGYPLYYRSADYVNTLENLTFTGNLLDGVVMEGSTVTTSRTWNAYTYYIINSNLYIGACRLTLMPGTTLKFAEGLKLMIGYSSSSRGELYAEGTTEQPITFTSLNGEAGGWNGIYFDNYSDSNSGQQSSLKHCIVENGNEYNLYMYSTDQPSLIESCTFCNSNGYGIYLERSSILVSKSTIRDNVSHGIYLENYSYPTVGGSPENANSIYNNGGYAVCLDPSYNANATLNMKYNFWGNIGSQEIDDNMIYDKKDNASLSRVLFEPVSWFPIDNFGHLQGTFTYNNDNTKLMANHTIDIINTGDTILATATTNSSGGYDFSNYAVDVYNTIDTLADVDILSGVNATDALLVMRHFVHLDTLTGNYVAIADVNVSGTINGTDAMLILYRAVDEQFPSGDFYYYTPNTMSISGDTCHYDLSFLCFGDVNGSYTPQNRDNSIELLHEGQLLVDSYQEMEVPISIKQAVEIGALTLHFSYPEEYLEIEDVVFATTGERLVFNATEGKLTTVWFSLEPLALAENDELIIVKVRTKDLSNIDEPVAFSLEAHSELADGSANKLEGLTIAMPVIITSTLGVGENFTADGVALSLYPNPAKDVCTLVYQLPEAGRVTVSVYNLMGVKVLDAANFHQESGQHELLLSTELLAAGMYSCRITFEGENSWVKTTKLIIEK